MKFVLPNSVFPFVLVIAVLTPLVFAISKDDNKRNDHKIVGGEQANVGDYPYFVEMGSCGGAPVAPHTVLFAAHCGDWKGKQVSVGAYRKRSLEDGAEERYCEDWVAELQFSSMPVLDYDFALCKLDSPVTIDKSKVRLVLNEHHSVPDTDDELHVMGLGHLQEGGAQGAEYLHHVKVPAISNKKCNENGIYSGGITDTMICVGFIDTGGKDASQGDSGGPLVQRIEQSDGTFIDMHVGIVSWGNGCARKNKPGVYARTSKRFPWIKDVICNKFNSTASFCFNEPSPPEPPVPCDNELTITVNTDDYGVETAWTLEDSNQTLVQKRKYLFGNHKNEHKLCLKSNECYL